MVTFLMRIALSAFSSLVSSFLKKKKGVLSRLLFSFYLAIVVFELLFSEDHEYLNWV